MYQKSHVFLQNDNFTTISTSFLYIADPPNPLQSHWMSFHPPLPITPSLLAAYHLRFNSNLIFSLYTNLPVHTGFAGIMPEINLFLTFYDIFHYAMIFLLFVLSLSCHYDYYYSIINNIILVLIISFYYEQYNNNTNYIISLLSISYNYEYYYTTTIYIIPLLLT